jgi:flagellar protein FlaF
MQYQGSEAYRQTRQKTAAPRELEAALLLAAAAHLQSVANARLEERQLHQCPTFRRAVTFNAKIWTILMTSAMRTDSALPEAIRLSIVELGLFVIHRTARLFDDTSVQNADQAVAVLIEINRRVASGLRDCATSQT